MDNPVVEEYVPPAVPIRITVPVPPPEQNGEPEQEIDADGAGFTVMVAAFEFAEVQTPLCTTDRYCVVWFILEQVCEVVVFAIVVHEEPPLVEYSHLAILPVLPVKLSVPLFAPEQTVAFEFTVPPTETGFTVIVTEIEFAEVQAPL